MAHGDPVVYGYGIEFGRKASQLFDLLLHKLAYVLQVHMARHKLGEGVCNGNHWLAKLAAPHPATGFSPRPSAVPLYLFRFSTSYYS